MIKLIALIFLLKAGVALMAAMQTIEFEGEIHEFPDNFTEQEISTALSGEEVAPPKIYAGKQAIKQVEKIEGTLTEPQQHIVKLEGYSVGEYEDSKGNKTRGVGQTGKYAALPFKEVYKIHEDRTKSRVPTYDNLPAYVQQELVQAEYRGDLGISPKFLAKLNAGDYAGAATEFLDNDEYRDSLGDESGIAPRMKMVHDALVRFAAEQPQEEQTTSTATPAKGGLFEDEDGVLFFVDDQGNKREV